jgi:hypothetical protein
MKQLPNKEKIIIQYYYKIQIGISTKERSLNYLIWVLVMGGYHEPVPLVWKVDSIPATGNDLARGRSGSKFLRTVKS